MDVSSGSMVFNTPYALALMAPSDEPLSKGIVTHTHDSSMPTENRNGSREGVHHILDVTFVDDGCIMLAADDPKSFGVIDHCTLVDC